MVARELGVRYVVEGSVRKAGDRVRVSAQLVDGGTGNHIWAERYDRDLEDIFALQDEITRTVVGAIEPELADAEIDKARRRPPDKLDAWDCYLRGMSHFYARTGEDYDRAEEFFYQAVELDPNMAIAYAAAAHVHFYQTTNIAQSTSRDHAADGYKTALKAVELDDEDAICRTALGMMHIRRGALGQAKLQFEKALQLNPSDGDALRWLGTSYLWSGDAKTSMPMFEESLRISPHDPLIGPTMVRMAEAHLYQGDYDGAINWARRALREPTTRFLGHSVLIAALAYSDRMDECQRALDDAIQSGLGVKIDFLTFLPEMLDESCMNILKEGLKKAGVKEK